MCGIVGYIGKSEAFPILLTGLKRLEYRGYDSFGFVVLGSGEPFLFKEVGKISEAEKRLRRFKIKGKIGIAHTRWATTGEVTEKNAHPQTDCKNSFFIVHNGIIENYDELKKKLIREGHKFSSNTDTEVIAHLIEKYYQGNLEESVRKAIHELEGTFGIAVLAKDEPDKIVATKMSSPLLLGIGNKEFILASDPSPIITRTSKVIPLDDYEIATFTQDDFHVLKEKFIQQIEWEENLEKKGKYKKFMLKEMFEEPEAVKNTFRGRLMEKEGNVKLGGLDDVVEKLRDTEKMFLVACGTAYYAAMIGKYMIEENAGISCENGVGSEFRYRKPVFLDPEKIVGIFVSQSGETADTLASLRELKKRGVLTIGVTNVVGSSQARETDAGIYLRSGPEIAVASTKTFLSQVTALILLTIFLGRQRKMNIVEGKKIIKALKEIPDKIEKILSKEKRIKKLAKKYSKYRNFIYVGRKYNYPIALEGALKLKEIAYPVHAEGYPAGEMKHGPLALAEEKFPFVGIIPQDSVYEKTFSNLEEVKARKSPILIVATEGDKRVKKLSKDIIYIPSTIEMLYPLLTVVPLHLFAYYMALNLGNDIDKPRNLAKSVTVE